MNTMSTVTMVTASSLFSMNPNVQTLTENYVPSQQILYVSVENPWCLNTEQSQYFSSVNAFIRTDKIFTELSQYMSLQHDWDGYGGAAPDPSIIDTAMTFLSDARYSGIVDSPKSMLTGSGEIGLYWENQYENFYLEVTFDHEGKYSYFFEHNDEVSGEDDVDFYEERVAAVIRNKLHEVFQQHFTDAA
ncbi:hypothetical protein ROM82_08005 [Cronobacter malonaticus]|uniref:hypothetical protein n=1 Tax=Cronobacter malonaticus TaxID=413503 RepID=UPI002893B691|nr:hypothetical protein [Cronobacter malonaticus]MDT3560216.1 hypothetical protein [Cronobacter malonaticus]